MPEAPLILFGAFDRHNLGDILLGHVAAREAAPRTVVHAGLAARDLTPWGGHRVRAIADLARAWGSARADLLHVGGELLGCDLYQAAVMLQTDDDARAAIARHDADARAGQAWAESLLGLRQRMAYLIPKGLFHNPGRFAYRAVGGVNLDALPAGQREEIRARLAEADAVSVRDRTTRAHLAALGIDADLEPDPASRVPALFGDAVARHGAAGEPARIRAAFPRGYMAVQFSAEHGDDASLALLARELETMAAGRRLGIVLFRAGAAPWHDDLAVYRRLAGCMGARPPRLFHALDVWDVCALLAGARAYCGTSLHGRILARAFRREALPFPLAPRSAKVAAYAETWGPGGDRGG